MVYDAASGGSSQVRAGAVLIATGGLGNVFLNTTNPDVATGDGVAMAWRAGAEIQDIEFVQFHPTALHVEGAPRFLLSEALRGEGAILRNTRGERFMEGRHPLKELAPRDVVAREIVFEMRRTGAPHVFLDLSHRGAAFIRERFPRIYETCMAHGIDLGTGAAPIAPAAHYAMGGVRTDLDGRTRIPRLFAAGEAACAGIHGANRLASNSLLEGVVLGARAGRAMRECAGENVSEAAIPEPGAPGGLPAEEIRRVAWEHCGIVRDRVGLEQACRLLEKSAPKPGGCASETAGARNMQQVALLIARAALAREESRGAHFRSDYPAKEAAFEKHSICRGYAEVVFR